VAGRSRIDKDREKRTTDDDVAVVVLANVINDGFSMCVYCCYVVSNLFWTCMNSLVCFVLYIHVAYRIALVNTGRGS
jgi:hypothetical protein